MGMRRERMADVVEWTVTEVSRTRRGASLAWNILVFGLMSILDAPGGDPPLVPVCDQRVPRDDDEEVGILRARGRASWIPLSYRNEDIELHLFADHVRTNPTTLPGAEVRVDTTGCREVHHGWVPHAGWQRCHRNQPLPQVVAPRVGRAVLCDRRGSGGRAQP